MRKPNGFCRPIEPPEPGIHLHSIYKEGMEREHNLPLGAITRAILEMPGQSERAFFELEKGLTCVDQFESNFSNFIQDSKPELAWIDTGEVFGEFRKRLTGSGILLDAVKWAKSEGLKVALLTNNFWADSAKTKSVLLGESHLFDVVVESCVEGVRKPDAEIYKRTLNQLQCAPEEAVFLDDLGHNLKAAKALGIKTVKVNQYHSPEALAELESVLGRKLSVPNTSEPREGMELDQEKLCRFLCQHFDEDLNPSQLIVRQFKHGQSNPTYFVRFGRKNLVLRKKPPGNLLPSAHMIEREYQVLNAVHSQGVPVPKVHRFCDDSSIIGTPFYIMDHVEGRVFLDVTLKSASPDERRAIYKAMNDVLVKIHSVDLQRAGLERYGKMGGYLERQLSRWGKQYEASKSDPFPEMEQLIEYLKSHKPQVEEKVTLVHGDYRLDNLIFHPEKPEVLAVLDWELSTIGDPLTDLATNCTAYFLPQREHSLLSGLLVDEKCPAGIPSMAEYTDMYYKSRSMTPIQESVWRIYVAFNFFRYAAICQGIYNRSLLGQASAPNAKKAGIVAKETAVKLAKIGLQYLNPTLEASTPEFGASDPNCKICIFMGKTDPGAQRHKQQSMILVPMDSPGLTVKRPMTAFGFIDAPGGHAEVMFENVRVPLGNMILGPGRGFEIAQGRLGPGRIHHCMRLIGHAERALDLMVKRAAANEIAMIKVAVPNMALQIIDRAIQAHGAMGVSQETCLPQLYVWARTLRIADGPDEVHLEAIAKRELKSHL